MDGGVNFAIVLILTGTLLCERNTCVNSAILNAKEFTSDLEKVTSEFDSIQKYLDEDVTFQQKTVSTRNLPELTGSLGKKFEQFIGAARQLEKAIEDDYENFGSNKGIGHEQCCDFKSAARDYRFKTEVDLSNVCVKVSDFAPENHTREYITSKVVEVMRENSRNLRDLRWQ
ncbi:unnamed protein product, partial [Owenia fusiformis]